MKILPLVVLAASCALFAQTPTNVTDAHDTTKTIAAPHVAGRAPVASGTVGTLAGGEWTTYNGDYSGRRFRR